MTAPALEIRGLQYRWRARPSFEIGIERLVIGRGERVLLVGPSGSGKSTLLNLICGIAAPDRGEIRVLGAPFSMLSGPRRDRLRAERFGVIFQMFNLLPYASPIDNVRLPLSFAPERRRRVGRDARAEAERLLRDLGLPDAVISASEAGALSVGQQQRVAVARALIGRPEIIVADEPTSALDAKAQESFLALLIDQVAAAGATLLLVSHDERIAHRFDRVMALPEIATVSREAAA